MVVIALGYAVIGRLLPSRQAAAPAPVTVAASAEHVRARIRAAGGEPDHITMNVYVTPIGRDVLKNLVDSGDLDAKVLPRIDEFFEALPAGGGLLNGYGRDAAGEELPVAEVRADEDDALDRQVVALGGAAGEDDLLGLRVDEAGNLVTRMVHGGFEGTDTRFRLHLPPVGVYQGRLFAPIQGGNGGSEDGFTTELVAGRVAPAQVMSPAQIRYLREVVRVWPLRRNSVIWASASSSRERMKGKADSGQIRMLASRTPVDCGPVARSDSAIYFCITSALAA